MKADGWMKCLSAVKQERKREECLAALTVCGLQHEATHERTAPTTTTIDLRHRWAIKGENTS